MFAALSNLVLVANAALFGMYMANHDSHYAAISGIGAAVICVAKIHVDVQRERVLLKQHYFISSYIEARQKIACEEKVER